MPQNLILPHPLPESPLFLLGRFVSSPTSPLDSYYPPRPPASTTTASQDTSSSFTLDKTLSTYLLPTHEEINYTLFITSLRKSTTQAKAQTVLRSLQQKSDLRKVDISAAVVRSWRLEQLRECFQVLISEMMGDKEDLKRFIEREGGKVYWVVGVKTISGAEVGMEEEGCRSDVRGAGVGEVIAAMGDRSGDVLESGGGVEVEEVRGIETLRRNKRRIDSEHIFAIRYCTISLKRDIFSNIKDKRLGEIRSNEQNGLGAKRNLLGSLKALREKQLKMQGPKDFSEKEGMSFVGPKAEEGSWNAGDCFQLDIEGEGGVEGDGGDGEIF